MMYLSIPSALKINRLIALITVCFFMTMISASARADTFTFAVATDTIDTVVSEVIVKKAYAMLGHEIQIIRLPPKRALERANAGEYDGDIQRIYSVAETHPNLIRIEPAINYINGTGFIHKDAQINASSWQDLGNYKVGIILGIRFAETNVPKKNAVIFYSYPELAKAISNHVIDIGIYPESNGIYQTLLTGADDIIPLSAPLARFDLYHYIHKKNEYLIPDLQRIFTEYEKDGTLAKIRKGVLEISFMRAREGLGPCYEDYKCYQSLWNG